MFAKDRQKIIRVEVKQVRLVGYFCCIRSHWYSPTGLAAWVARRALVLLYVHVHTVTEETNEHAQKIYVHYIFSKNMYVIYNPEYYMIRSIYLLSILITTHILCAHGV